LFVVSESSVDAIDSSDIVGPSTFHCRKASSLGTGQLRIGFVGYERNPHESIKPAFRQGMHGPSRSFEPFTQGACELVRQINTIKTFLPRLCFLHRLHKRVPRRPGRLALGDVSCLRSQHHKSWLHVQGFFCSLRLLEIIDGTKTLLHCHENWRLLYRSELHFHSLSYNSLRFL